MNKYLKIILDKMCEYVGIESVNPKKKDWFLDHSWTLEQQDEFEEWYSAFIKDMKIQRELYEYPERSKKSRDEKAHYFVMNYGWKIDV